MVGRVLKPISVQSEFVTALVVFDNLEGFDFHVLDIPEDGLHALGETVAYEVLLREISGLGTANLLVERAVRTGRYEGWTEPIISRLTASDYSKMESLCRDLRQTEEIFYFHITQKIVQIDHEGID